MKILYLATDVFLKGGIQRYARAQITALRNIAGGGNARSLSIHSAGANSFEEPFQVDYAGRGLSLRGRVGFSGRAILYALHLRPELIWVNHVHLLPLARILKVFSPKARVFVNVYGLELWSGREKQIQRDLHHVDFIVSDSGFSAQYVAQNFAVDGDKLTVIWDPVDVNRFRLRPRDASLLARFGIPLRPESRYLMSLGRLDSGAMHKGYHRLLDAMKLLIQNPNVYCIIGGEGDQRPMLEKRVQEEGLAGRVFFIGSVNEPELADVYNLCHVFSLVSERGHGKGEGVPLTPLEAAACCKPILVGNEDGSQEAVIHGENGFVVSPRDRDAYLSCARKLLEDDSLRERMGSNARMRIENEFSETSFAEKHRALLARFFAV